MGLMDFVKKQFIDIIQWTEPGDGVLAWRFPTADLEIQQGTQLVVRETQMAVFVHEGQVADLFGPGQHTIRTQNLPLLTDLRHWGKLFESPFKSEVYFFSTRLRLNQTWGTAHPITVRDTEFGAVRQTGVGPKLSETPGAVRTLAPKRGEHTDALLREAGYTGPEIEAMRATNAAG